MNLTKQELWEKFQKRYSEYPSIGLALDLSRMDFSDDALAGMEGKLHKALSAMTALESGAIANPDEKRMVGHYWLRNPALAPNAEIRNAIEHTLADIKQFAKKIHSGEIKGQGGCFKNLLVIGIGGSALGPQFVSRALGCPKQDKLKVFFFDNTDPDGMERVLLEMGAELNQTLTIVISKSGSTKETKNGMIEAENAYNSYGFKFNKHTIAITGVGSELDKHASSSDWIARFPMWDWVGGRTSELSAVGLLPAALQGINIDNLIAGAKACDEVTRQNCINSNPAALISFAIYNSGSGRGAKAMVVLPYKDRLELFSKYLQQLVMESLGKEKDLNNNVVNQGLSVFGNKGATDQHSYIQQLRDGLNNFFAVFIEVLKDRKNAAIFVEPNVTSGDYLSGFFLGTRRALYENNRESITLTINEVSPFSIGMLIALFERVVGLYAVLIDINAYHQPGVEAGKKAATEIILLQGKIISFFQSHKNQAFGIQEIANQINGSNEIESIFKICNHLAANTDRGIKKINGATILKCQFQFD